MKRKADWTTVALWLCAAAILMLAGNVIRKTVMIVRMTPIQMEGTSPYIRMDVNEELKKARKGAVSIGAYNEPDCPELLGIMEEGILGKVYYYKDKTGRYFYQSERTMRVEKEIQERQKKKRPFMKEGTLGKMA